MKWLEFSVALLLLGTCVFAEEEGGEKEDDAVGTVIGIDLGTTYSW